jgi:hypothetical protein
LNEKGSFLGQHCRVFPVVSAGLWALTMVHYIFMLLAEKKLWQDAQQGAQGES